jgi:hypothetical protein
MAQSIALAPNHRCAEGLLGWAEPITAFPRERGALLKKQEKNKQGPVFGRIKPLRWHGSREITGDYPVHISE